MRGSAVVNAVVPAFNEAPAIAKVLAAIPLWVDRVVVVDNGSTDATAELARANGATVVHEPRRGYGAACQAGIRETGNPDIVVFLDADFSDDPRQMDRLVDPLVADAADLVIGSRVTGRAQFGALSPQQRIGNRVACALMRLRWGVEYTDLGPFRAIRFDALRRLGLQDPDFGWTVEMQIKAVQHGLRICEVPISYRPRIGCSKISGTVSGSVKAAVKILSIIVFAASNSSSMR